MSWDDLKPGDKFIDGNDKLSVKYDQHQYRHLFSKGLLIRVPGSKYFDFKSYPIITNTCKCAGYTCIIEIPSTIPVYKRLSFAEAFIIEQVYKECKYNQAKTARELQISRVTLRTKLKLYFEDKYI